jgi:hypothetical protein
MTVEPRAAGPTGVTRWPKAIPGSWAVLAVTVLVVWNGIFDLLVTRGVKEYLYRHAEHELGRGRAVTMNQIMGQTVADASATAWFWALFVGLAGASMVVLAARGAHR